MTDKDKIEMYEKEASLLLKEIALVVTVAGSLIVFVVNHIDFESLAKLDEKQLNGVVTAAVYAMLIFWFNFGYRLVSTIERYASLKKKIERINDA